MRPSKTQPRLQSASLALNPKPPQPRHSSRLAAAAAIAALGGHSGRKRPPTLMYDAKDRDKGKDVQAAERYIAAYKPGTRPNDTKLIPTLLAFVRHLPDEGREIFVQDINEAKNNDALWGVFQGLLAGVLCPLISRSTKKTLVSPSPSPSPSLIRKTVPPPACLVTKWVNVNGWKELGRPMDIEPVEVEVAQILPLASWDIDMDLDILCRYFPSVHRLGFGSGLESDRTRDGMEMKTKMGMEKEEQEEATGQEARNEILLERYIRLAFEDFQFAFVATISPDIEDEYTIITYPTCPPVVRVALAQLPDGKRVNFKHAGVSLSPILLDCHHRLSNILHSSGTDKYIRHKMARWDNLKRAVGTGHLSDDGSTDIGRFLAVAFWDRVGG
ncbi:uncharacterized protein BDV17DRAFT_294060 [Aspergillus undulatus]|uniref:uncharacterized protein n=1 Tax=Aspergillus undulatus TaxID=1810928 RepID=UPI003CCD11F7